MVPSSAVPLLFTTVFRRLGTGFGGTSEGMCYALQQLSGVEDACIAMGLPGEFLILNRKSNFLRVFSCDTMQVR